MDFQQVVIKKAQWWQEIKSLEQEYKRLFNQIKELEKDMADISFEIQKRFKNINDIGEKYDQYCFENKVGEYSETNTK